MSLGEFIGELREAAKTISDESLRKELTPLLDEGELAGLDKKIKVALNRLIESFEK